MRKRSTLTKLRAKIRDLTRRGFYAFDFQNRESFDHPWDGSFFGRNAAEDFARNGRRDFVICIYSLDAQGEIEELYDTIEFRL
jgi:hypothetical protein